MAEKFSRVVVVDHPLVQHKLSILRDKNTPNSQFRQLVREIALLEFYEVSRYLKLEPVTVETPMMTTECQRLAGLSPVIVPILRAGLGMLDGLLALIPTACVGHLGMERDASHIAREYYAKMPKDIDQRLAVVVDPMLATGGSAIAAIEYLRNRGAKDIILMVLVSAPEGIRAIRKVDDETLIVTCAIDEGLNDNAYILPGLGDAGDRIFGTL